MKKLGYRLLNLLEILDKEDLKTFGSFLDCRMFNKNEVIKGVYSYLENNKNRAEIILGRVSFVEIFQEIFPEKNYTVNNIRVQLNQLQSVVEEYISIKSFKSDRHNMKQYYLLEGLFNKINSAERSRENIIELLKYHHRIYLKSSSVSEGAFGMETALGNSLLLDHLSAVVDLQHRFKIKTIKKEELIEKRIQSWTESFLIHQLYHIYEHRNLNLRKGKTEASFFEIPILELARTYSELPDKKYLIQILLHLLTQPDVDSFIDYVREFHDEIEQTDLRNLFIIMSNENNRAMMNSRTVGESTFYRRKMFEMYKFQHQLDLLFPEGEMVRLVRLKNIIANCGYILETKWARELLRSLEGDIPNQADINVLEAHILFYEKKYQKAYATLDIYAIDPRRISPTYYRDARYLELKILYHLKHLNMENRMDSLERAMRENKVVAQASKRSYINFILILRQIIEQESLPRSNRNFLKIEKKLNSYDKFANREWIEEIMNDLR